MAGRLHEADMAREAAEVARQQAEEICEGKLALKAVTQSFG